MTMLYTTGCFPEVLNSTQTCFEASCEAPGITRAQTEILASELFALVASVHTHLTDSNIMLSTISVMQIILRDELEYTGENIVFEHTYTLYI